MSTGLRIVLWRRHYVKIAIENMAIKMTYVARYFNDDLQRVVKLKFEGVNGLIIDGEKVGGDTWNPMVLLRSSVNLKYKDKILSIELNRFEGAQLVTYFQGPHDFYVSRMTKEEKDEEAKRKILPEEV